MYHLQVTCIGMYHVLRNEQRIQVRRTYSVTHNLSIYNTRNARLEPHNVSLLYLSILPFPLVIYITVAPVIFAYAFTT